MPIQCVIFREMSFENIQHLFDLSLSKHRSLIFCMEKLDHRMKKKLSMQVCSWEGVLTIFYSAQARMKRVWDPLLPQITKQCESLCKKLTIFENQLELTFGFHSGLECFGYMSIHPSLSFQHAIHILSRSVQEVSSPLRMTMFLYFLRNFQKYNTSATGYIFLLTDFSLLYRHTHGA